MSVHKTTLREIPLILVDANRKTYVEVVDWKDGRFSTLWVDTTADAVIENRFFTGDDAEERAMAYANKLMTPSWKDRIRMLFRRFVPEGK